MKQRYSGLKTIGVLLALFAFTATPAGAGEDAAEFYVNTYRSMAAVSPKNARSKAMGGSGRGLADGVGSLGVNPAALGAFSGSGFDVGLGYDWLDDGYDDADQVTFTLGGAVNLDRWHATGDAANQAVGGLVHSQSYSGAADIGMKRDQVGVLMGYGLQITDDFLAGISVALFDGKWKSKPVTTTGENGETTESLYINRKYTGGDFKLGGLYRFNYETTVGGAINYATGSHKEKSKYYATKAGSGDIERFGIGLGVAHQYSDETLLVGDIWYDKLKSDIPGILKEDNKAWGLSVGVEQQVLPEVMALRGGLYYDRTSYSANGQTLAGGGYSKGRFGITAGVGVKLYSFDLGYSLDINSGGDVKNLLDLSAEW